MEQYRYWMSSVISFVSIYLLRSTSSDCLFFNWFTSYKWIFIIGMISTAPISKEAKKQLPNKWTDRSMKEWYLYPVAEVGDIGHHTQLIYSGVYHILGGQYLGYFQLFLCYVCSQHCVFQGIILKKVIKQQRREEIGRIIGKYWEKQRSMTGRERI